LEEIVNICYLKGGNKMPEEKKKEWVEIDLTEIEIVYSLEGIGPAFLLNTVPDLMDYDHPPVMTTSDKGSILVSVYTSLSKKEIVDKLVKKHQKRQH
jgi:hypothetical protein